MLMLVAAGPGETGVLLARPVGWEPAAEREAPCNLQLNLSVDPVGSLYEQTLTILLDRLLDPAALGQVKSSQGPRPIRYHVPTACCPSHQR